jgi:hypothetical protein
MNMRSIRFAFVLAAAVAATSRGFGQPVSPIWYARHPDSTAPSAALSQQAVAVAHAFVYPPGSDGGGTAGTPSVYVLGTYEDSSGAFKIATRRYPVAGATNHEPDAQANWPDTTLTSAAVAKKLAVVTTGSSLDVHNYVYVLGQAPGAAGQIDTIVLRYDSDLHLLWSARHSGAYDNVPVALAADADHVAVAVASVGAGTGTDIEVVVYRTGDGVELSKERIASAYEEWPAAVFLDPSEVIVAGTMYDPSAQHYKYVTAAWDPVSGSALWSSPGYRLSGVPGTDCYATDACLGPFKARMYVTGYSQYPMDQTPTKDYFTTAVSYLDGHEVWNDSHMPAHHGLVYNGGGVDQAVKICAVFNDAEFHFKVFVTGNSQAAAGDNDIVTLKYDDYDTYVQDPITSVYAAPEWIAPLNAGTWPNGYFGAADGPMDIQGWFRKNEIEGWNREEVYVTGFVTNASGNEDYVTLKYRGTNLQPGQFQTPTWLLFYAGPGNGHDSGAALGLDFVSQDPTIGNDVFVTGRSDGGATHDDFLTARYQDLDIGQ